jgi:DNA ligase-1
VTTFKDFKSVDECQNYAESTRSEKLKKGYQSVGVESTAAKMVKTEATEPVHVAVASAAASTARAQQNSSSDETVYLECTEGSSRKFYELAQAGNTVKIRYGRMGTDGVSSEKDFKDEAAAADFVAKTRNEKEKKGYSAVSNASAGVPEEAEPAIASTGNLADDLELGLKVHIQGSSALPYTLKKFNGGYSCTCQGWVMQIRHRGIQAASCKHLKLVRGEETEAERCQLSAGVVVPSGKKNASIPAKISLAQQWSASIDPAGYILSEKLDGMRAYWCGKKLWTRSGLAIVAPDWFLAALPPALALDGELFLGRKLFDECMSIARRTDASNEWKALSYVVFDAPNARGGIMDRLAHAEGAYQSALAKKNANKVEVYWKIHPQVTCEGIEHLLEELARVEALGGEGLMLRSASAAHRGGRSSDLLKVKSFHDDEALVTAHEEGKGKYQGQVGSLVCVSRKGARFKVGSGLIDSMRGYKQAPQPGTVITFKYFELTKDGIPRFPTFLRVRPDVDKSEFPAVN